MTDGLEIKRCHRYFDRDRQCGLVVDRDEELSRAFTVLQVGILKEGQS